MSGAGSKVIRLSVFDMPGDDGRVTVEIEHQADGRVTRARATTAVTLNDGDRGDLRWYLEDYLTETYPPGPTRAARIEARMEELGEGLFRDLFQCGDDTRNIWAQLRNDLADTRVEVSSSIAAASLIPWELLREPRTGRWLALVASGFVRSQSNQALAPILPTLRKKDKLRVLLVICRPDGGDDVPLRSVAGRLLKSITEAGRERVELSVLRPPTYDHLATTLRAAQREGVPYHIVHFDGHGCYGHPPLAGGAFNRHRYDMAAPKRGFLVFEGEDEGRLIDGPTLGGLLREADVPVLLLNACRSAHSDGPEADPDAKAKTIDAAVGDQVKAFGSLAQQVMDAGVAGVLAMRYNVWVVTAAQYVEALYAALARGADLGTAAAEARRNLADKPSRRIAGDPVNLRDWQVPVVFEAQPIALLPPVKRKKTESALFDLSAGGAFVGGTDWLGSDGMLPRPPEVGFIGRDETVLALDRGFDKHRVALLHAFAGAGKTSTAAEFARWYAATGGLGQRPVVLFDSFEVYDHAVTLPGLLDKLGGLFGPSLEASGRPPWHSLDDRARRQVALSILAQVPLLWIWDNMEPVAGFPAGTDSAWSVEQQGELRDFLADIANLERCAARVLLTSRRDESGWLGAVPYRVPAPPLARWDQLALAEKLMERRGRDTRFSWVLEPLLRYCGGNPMTLTILVGQALRDGLDTTEKVEAYVEALRRGEGRFDDDVRLGRTRSLGASLAHGFEAAFNDAERQRLALLWLFQGFLNTQVLVVMGHPKNPGRQPAYADLTRDDWLPLLSRAAEIGLLTDHGNGHFSIHPALPWFLRDLFTRSWPGGDQGDGSPAHAYAIAIADLGNTYHRWFNGGRREDALAELKAEEGNLRHALTLAHRNGWVDVVFRAMQGVRFLYVETGRIAAWRRLVAQARPLVAAPDDRPLPGRDETWGLWIDYESDLARIDRDSSRLLGLLRLTVAVTRERAAPVLAQDTIAEPDRGIVRFLAVALQQLGTALAADDDSESVPALTEAAELFRRIGDRAGEAIAAFNLGHAYRKVTAIRDLGAAEEWYRKSLELFDNDADRAGCHGQLGQVAFERFDEARKNREASERVNEHLRTAEEAYQTALSLTPADAHADLATMHNALGTIYGSAGLLDPAADHFRKSVEHELKRGNRFGAAETRFNLAVLYLQHRRLGDARAYAETALADFQSFGGRAAADEAKTQRLLDAIAEAEAKAANPRPSGERVEAELPGEGEARG